MVLQMATVALPVVAMGTSFGPFGTRHHHRDSGRSHDVANGYCGPSHGGHGDI